VSDCECTACRAVAKKRSCKPTCTTTTSTPPSLCTSPLSLEHCTNYQLTQAQLHLQSLIGSDWEWEWEWEWEWLADCFAHSLPPSLPHSLTHSVRRCEWWWATQTAAACCCFVRSFVRSFIHSFVRSFVRSFADRFLGVFGFRCWWSSSS